MGEKHQIGASGYMAGGNNIAALREARGWKRPKLAELMGTSTQQVERLEKSQRRLTQDWIERAARALEVSPADIITLNYDGVLATLPQPAAAASDADTVEIGKLDLSLSMGPGTIIDDYVEETSYNFDSRLLRLITRTPPNRLKLVTGIGDSNYPTLQHADDILIDTSDRMMSRQDGFYWIDLYGAAGLKRLRAVGKKRILVQSDNPAVANQEVDADDLRIHGRAIWVMRGL